MRHSITDMVFARTRNTIICLFGYSQHQRSLYLSVLNSLHEAAMLFSKVLADSGGNDL